MQLLGVGLFLIGSIFVFLGQDIFRNPEKYTSNLQIQIEAEPLRLLKYLYELQVKYDLHKLVIGRDGVLSGNINGIAQDINVIQVFFSLNQVDEKAKLSFEKLLFKIPVTYLRNIPETRSNSPYILSITQEGIAKIK